MRLLSAFALLALGGAAGGWWITAPDPLPAETFTALTGDPVRGAVVFTAAGCASCHAAPGATGEAELVLAGGQRFPSDFGTFLAPNISPSAAGIGGWTVADLGNALMRGVSPEGAHYYPALPYASYAKMQPQDVADLHAYMQTLPPSDTASLPNELAFPFNIRRSVGVWKALFLTEDWVLTGDLTAEEVRGREIVEALAHCGECHTPRTALGGMDTARWLAGAANPSGEGMIPDITPSALTWSTGEIVTYLTTGFTPEFDSVGGHMAHVVANMAKLPASDRQAVAAYLKKVPAAE
jgi:mono/diheme cytochrome c family protein